MTIIIIFAISVFTLFAIYRVLSTFVGGRASQIRAEFLGDEVREVEQLVARREVLLDALRELEFEFETDKVSDEDYQTYKHRYEREAVAIMRRLADLHGGQGWGGRIDAELEERLGHAPRSAEMKFEVGDGNDDEPRAETETPSDEADEPAQHADEADEPEPQDDEPEDQADDPEEERDDEPADDRHGSNGELAADDATQGLELTCSNCGKPLEPEDAFCSQCGTPVTPPGTTGPAVDEVTP